MGGVGGLACQGFLVREACISVLVRGTCFFPVKCNGVHSKVPSFEMGLCVRCDLGQPVC